MPRQLYANILEPPGQLWWYESSRKLSTVALWLQGVSVFNPYLICQMKMVTVALLCVFGVGTLLMGRVGADDCMGSQVGCCPAPNPVLYYKVMTPQWLEDHASLSHLTAATAASLQFKMTKGSARVIKVPLFQRGELPTNDISVSITLHLEDPPTADSDFLLAICDGTQCNGFWIQDKGNYPASACLYTSVKSGITYTNEHTTPGGCGASITFEHFPNTAKLTFYPANKWGSFSIPPSGGYTTAKTFTDQMDVANGLYVEAYGNNVNEQYKLMFMEVKVTKN